jgi:hypothetical protein
MSNHHPIRCSFQLLRYVPDPVRNEFVHVGVLLREEAGGTHIRFTHDWRRVRCLDPDADTALLEGMETELKARLAADADGKLRRILDEALSLSVQMTEPKAFLAESIAAGLDELMRLYVDPPPRQRVSQLHGRAAVHAAMRGAFEQAAVWDLMRKQIRAAQYTRPGDPLRIDAGYRPNGRGPQQRVHAAGVENGIIKMFHAVSLDSGTPAGVESAKILAFSAAALRAGVERIEKASLELTAIVEPAAQLATEDTPERLELYRFGVETMEEHSIRVLTTTDLPRLAATARRELHVE